MSLPDKCQFCGCDADTRSKSGAWVYYVCTSSVHDGRDARRNQSRLCEEKERLRLQRELAAAREENANLRVEVNHNWQATDDLEKTLKDLAAAQVRIAELERELEQAKHDRNRIAHETRMEFLPKLEQQSRRIGELEKAGDGVACLLPDEIDSCDGWFSAMASAKSEWLKAKGHA